MAFPPTLSHHLFLFLILIFITYYSHSQIVDAILSNANDSLAIGSCVIDANAHTTSLSDTAAAEHSKLTGERCGADEVKQKIQIPTAIVKPKYQKAAFDDRQLPIIARVDRNEPWYDRQCATSENSTIKNSTKKVVQMPEGERKVKKRSKQHQNTVKSAPNSSADHKMISVRGNGNGSATKEQSKAFDAFEKDTNGRRCVERKPTSVAVVQPRKKEKMDERKLMETIVQMQIKKNSMDTRNNNQRSGPQNALPTTTAKTPTSTTSESPKDASGKFRFIESPINDFYIGFRFTLAAASFDVYNIETALPVIDLEAIENHLKIAKAEERRVSIRMKMA